MRLLLFKENCRGGLKIPREQTRKYESSMLAKYLNKGQKCSIIGMFAMSAIPKKENDNKNFGFITSFARCKSFHEEPPTM